MKFGRATLPVGQVRQVVRQIINRTWRILGGRANSLFPPAGIEVIRYEVGLGGSLELAPHIEAVSARQKVTTLLGDKLAKGDDEAVQVADRHVTISPQVSGHGVDFFRGKTHGPARQGYSSNRK